MSSATPRPVVGAPATPDPKAPITRPAAAGPRKMLSSNSSPGTAHSRVKRPLRGKQGWQHRRHGGVRERVGYPEGEPEGVQHPGLDTAGQDDERKDRHGPETNRIRRDHDAARRPSVDRGAAQQHQHGARNRHDRQDTAERERTSGDDSGPTMAGRSGRIDRPEPRRPGPTTAIGNLGWRAVQVT